MVNIETARYCTTVPELKWRLGIEDKVKLVEILPFDVKAPEPLFIRNKSPAKQLENHEIFSDSSELEKKNQESD